MTGIELITFIQNNHLEDYTFIVSHETGESAYPITETYKNHEQRTVELY